MPGDPSGKTWTHYGAPPPIADWNRGGLSGCRITSDYGMVSPWILSRHNHDDTFSGKEWNWESRSMKMDWNRPGWLRLWAATIWLETSISSKRTSRTKRTSCTERMDGRISKTERPERLLVSRSASPAGAPTSLICVITGSRTSSWRRAASIPKWKRCCRTILSRLPARSSAIWAIGDSKNAWTRADQRFRRRVTVKAVRLKIVEPNLGRLVPAACAAYTHTQAGTCSFPHGRQVL